MKRLSRHWTLAVFIAFGGLFLSLFLRDMRQDKQESLRELEALGKTVYFEGEVIDAPVYRNTTLLCVRIDSAGVDSLYHFSRHCAVVVREGVAVLPIGLIDQNDSTDSFKSRVERVVVNRDYDRKILFIWENDTIEETFSLWPGKIEEVHLLMAWENARAIADVPMQATIRHENTKPPPQKNRNINL